MIIIKKMGFKKIMINTYFGDVVHLDLANVFLNALVRVQLASEERLAIHPHGARVGVGVALQQRRKNCYHKMKPED